MNSKLYLLPKHFIKYLLVGGLNAAFTFLIYFLLIKVFAVHYLISFSLSWVFGVLFTYIINFLWVFKPEQKLQFKKRLFKYYLVYITSYLINLLLLKIIKESTGYDPLVVQLFILPLVIVINFCGIKYWALKR